MKIALTPELMAQTNAYLARHFGVTPMAVLFARRRAAGLCVRCGEKAATEGCYCAAHAKKERAYQRKRGRVLHGWKPWKPGKPGRPPKGRANV